jgi:hypothetical protein
LKTNHSSEIEKKQIEIQNLETKFGEEKVKIKKENEDEKEKIIKKKDVEKDSMKKEKDSTILLFQICVAASGFIFLVLLIVFGTCCRWKTDTSDRKFSPGVSNEEIQISAPGAQDKNIILGSFDPVLGEGMPPINDSLELYDSIDEVLKSFDDNSFSPEGEGFSTWKKSKESHGRSKKRSKEKELDRLSDAELLKKIEILKNKNLKTVREKKKEKLREMKIDNLKKQLLIAEEINTKVHKKKKKKSKKRKPKKENRPTRSRQLSDSSLDF